MAPGDSITNNQPKHRSKRVTPISDSPASPASHPAPSWKLVRCENGLRFFEELGSVSKLPVLKAVGVVKGQAESVFDEIMNYGPERFQWDHTVETASILEIVDDHSDIIHLCLKQDSRWLSPRDLCISRYWKREANGSYTIFYRSTSKHPVQSGHVRATVHSGGYIVTPLLTSGKPKSLVESVFQIDVGGWPCWFVSDYSAQLRKNLLGVIAGLREYFAANRVDSSISLYNLAGLTASGTIVPHTPFLGTDLEDFHDARAEQLSDTMSEIGSPKAPEVHRNECTLEKEFSFSKLSGSLPKGPLMSGRNSYAEPDPTSFKVRSKDGSSVPARDPHFKLVAVDWYKSQHRLDNVSARRNIVQEAPTKDVFFFTFNLQVPHSGSYYSLIFYFVSRKKPAEGSLLHRYIHGNDEFRSQRLLLLPLIPEGSWMVRQAVGSRAVILGQILECNHFSGSNYAEVDVNMGSSSIVRGVMSIVFGYMSALVVDMGFSLRAETDDELPEEFLGAVRCSRLDLSRAVMVS